MAKGKTCIIYRSGDKIYLKFNSMIDAGRYLGYTGKSFAEKIVKTNHSYKGWLSTTTIPEDWFIRKGFKEGKKIEGGYGNAKIVRVVPNDEVIVSPNQKELDEFVKTLKLGIE